MDFIQLVNSLYDDTKGSLGPFAPELVLCATIVVMLLARMIAGARRLDSFYLALLGSLIALYFASPWSHLGAAAGDGLARQEIFTGMLVYDPLGVFIRGLLLFFLVLFTIFTKLSGIPDREDAADFYTLVLGATLGMCIMATANHLLTIFLGVEMASLPSYVLAGMLKGRRRSSEAAIKYAVYGAGAAGVMLYGISLLAGVLNSAHLPTMAAQLAAMDVSAIIQEGDQQGAGQLMVLALGGLMVMVGLCFKLSAVPFHFWCPDVFEGASAEVNAFLSVASKAAALALLIRVAVGLGTVPPETVSDTTSTAVVQSSAEQGSGFFAVDDQPQPHPKTTQTESEPHERPVLNREQQVRSLAPVRGFIARLIALVAIITCTFGNLAAYGQTNIKRLLAYSTIAHAGYMMMPVAAAIALAGVDTAAAEAAIASLGLYIGIYLFMNLGAFAVVAFLRNAIRSEEIADYAGLVRRCPGVVVCFSLILFSLIGLPPLAGFFGKFAVFAALMEGYQITSAGYLMLLLWVGGLNTVVSLFYYLRVVKVMTIDPEPEDRTPVSFPMVSFEGLYIALVTLPLVLLILDWNWLNKWALAAARQLM